MLYVDKITGFSVPLSSVIILDDRGIPFYQMVAQDDKPITFNLPAGMYDASEAILSVIEKLKRPLRYITPTLPKYERTEFPAPTEFEIIFQPNPNKCSVDKGVIGKMRIICDPSFKVHPKPFLAFIWGHELGHYKYKSEWKCDLFSAKMMLERGFNPSQCYHASHHTLSKGERKEDLFNFLLNTKVR